MPKSKKSVKVAKATKAYKRAVKTSKPGQGKRFAALSGKLSAEGYSEKSSKAIAASIGRKKYGAKKMAKFSAKGRSKKY